VPGNDAVNLRSRRPRRAATVLSLLLAGALVGAVPAAPVPAAPAQEDAYAERNPDPWESFNRGVFRFNMAVDKAVLRPVARGYVRVTPEPVRQGVSNFFDNLRMPIVVVNSLLQGKVRESGSGTGRFLVNTTVGLLGVFDVATKMGLERHEEDLGQTLAVWGIQDGPYLVLPLLGPSTVRDGVGLVGDFFLDPVYYVDDREVRYWARGIRILDTRANLLHLDRMIDTAFDPYLFVRDAYLQRRQFLIYDGDPPPVDYYDIEPPDETSR